MEATLPPAVISTRGLTKHYGSVRALTDLDLEVRRGRDLRLPGTERRRQVDHHPHSCSASSTRRAGARSVLGWTSCDDSVEIRAPDGLPARRHRALRLADRRAGARLPRRAARPRSPLRAELCDRLELSRSDPARGRSATTRAACARRSASSRRSSTTRSWRSWTSRPRASTRSCSTRSTPSSTTCARGRTIFFSSHVLSEVERVCDRVAIIRAGKLVACPRRRRAPGPPQAAVELRWRGAAPDSSARRAHRRAGRRRPDVGTSRAMSAPFLARSPRRTDRRPDHRARPPGGGVPGVLRRRREPEAAPELEVEPR